MSMPRISLTVFFLAALSVAMIPVNAAADNTVSPNLFTQYINRIIWVDWHSGGKSYTTEGTLQTVFPEQNCISLMVRRKFPEEILKFDGSRILYINLSSIDAFEIRLPD